MDFRLVKPADIAWTVSSRGQPAARTSGGAKVVVQTPLCPCRVTATGGGMYRMHLALRPDLPVHSAFSDWLCEVDESASESEALREWRGGRSRSVALYNNSLRLTAFSDTLAFDATGKLSADLLSAGGCACIIELQGAWATEARWGVRWRVVQIKFSEDCELPAAACAIDDETCPPGPAPGAYSFLDDA